MLIVTKAPWYIGMLFRTYGFDNFTPLVGIFLQLRTALYSNLHCRIWVWRLHTVGVKFFATVYSAGLEVCIILGLDNFTSELWSSSQLQMALILFFCLWVWRLHTYGGNFSTTVKCAGLYLAFSYLEWRHTGGVKFEVFHSCVRCWFGSLHHFRVWVLHTKDVIFFTTVNVSVFDSFVFGGEFISLSLLWVFFLAWCK